MDLACVIREQAGPVWDCITTTEFVIVTAEVGILTATIRAWWLSVVLCPGTPVAGTRWEGLTAGGACSLEVLSSRSVSAVYGDVCARYVK